MAPKYVINAAIRSNSYDVKSVIALDINSARNLILYKFQLDASNFKSLLNHLNQLLALIPTR